MNMTTIKKSCSYIWIFTLVVIGSSGFDPFMDNELHKIEWVDKSTFSLEEMKDKGVVEMMTVNHEKYMCILPELTGKDDESKKVYGGLSGFELIQTMFQQSSCSYRIESYWTYELCHGKHLRQYHENKELSLKKPQVLEYYLGYYQPVDDKKDVLMTDKDTTEAESRAEDKKLKVKTRRIDLIDLPYFESNMTDGTVCELTNQPRKAKILYVCQPEGRGEIYELKETSSCEYEVIVLTSVLCSHPDFKPKTPPVSTISCLAMDGSPTKPETLTDWEKQPVPQYDHQVQGNFILQREMKKEEPPKPPSTPKQPQKPDTTLTDTTDKQVLREFLSGDYCFQGGTGWWKHEFCFNKHARQFHDGNDGRIVINLGYWNEDKHLEWIAKNPSKMPKPKGQRKQLSLLYTGGDTCDITGKNRIVEVKLKCIEKKNQPHSVSIYLMEPKSCEYVLGIESPLLCNVLDRADTQGIIKDYKV
ncbi:endoplasmic reticulum lectin 1-like [Mytilus trossulus]|uniref:endoplasmic reticulum lectin 1-like n=1 Tax=Mytilus trossulus TaxID=6551 RepID=UPI003007BE2B